MATALASGKVVVDIPSKRGDTFRKIFKYSKKIAGVVSADAISDSTFRFIVSTKISGGTTVKELTIGNGLTIQNTNELVVEIPADEMTMEPGIYYYEIERTYTADGTVVTRPEGRITVTPDL